MSQCQEKGKLINRGNYFNFENNFFDRVQGKEREREAERNFLLADPHI